MDEEAEVMAGISVGATMVLGLFPMIVMALWMPLRLPLITIFQSVRIGL